MQMAHFPYANRQLRTSARFLFLAACLLLCTCSKKPSQSFQFKKDSDGKPIIRLQQQWYANSGFAGELFAAEEPATNYGFHLQVIRGSDQIDTKQVVKLGEAEFGVAGAEQILQANENANANLLVVGVINYQSLACFISKKAKEIMKPKDLEGHRIGTMEGSPVHLVYQALKIKEGLKIPKQDEIPTQWVLTGFLRDDYDVYPAFVNDEPITLSRQGVEVNKILPSQYGVEFIGTVYFCKRELAESSPETVQNFINAIAEGWNSALKDPRQAIAYLKKYDPNIDESKETESLLSGRDFYKGEDGRVLYCKEDTWDKMAKLLVRIGVLKGPYQYNRSVENKFVTWYHSKVAPAGP